MSTDQDPKDDPNLPLTRYQWLNAGLAFANAIESRRELWEEIAANGDCLNRRAVEVIQHEAERLAVGGEPVEISSYKKER